MVIVPDGSLFAIVAHYSQESVADQVFIKLVNSISRFSKRVLVVSTSYISNNGELNPGVEIMVRPNIGYDFYSYKLGLRHIRSEIQPQDSVLFVNSSFVIVDDQIFDAALRSCLEKAKSTALVGLSLSRQYATHVQSYFLLANFSNLNQAGLIEFMERVKPLASKHNTIVDQEIGLSQAAILGGLALDSLYRPSPQDWIRYLFTRYGRDQKAHPLWFFENLLRVSKGVNPVHYFALPLIECAGIIKREVLHSNPLGIPLRPRVFSEITAPVSREAEIVWSFDRGSQGLTPTRSAVVLHAYYPETVTEILAALDNIPEYFSLVVTSSRDDVFDEILRNLPNNASSVKLVKVENRGRDIKPFMHLLEMGLLDDFDAVLKIHTKRSAGMGYGDYWRRDLIRTLLGNSPSIAQTLEALSSNRYGLVGPSIYLLTNNRKYWGANWQNSNILRQLLRLKVGSRRLSFFAGSMFWLNPKALDGLGRLVNHIHFEDEQGQIDGTFAHAVERLFVEIAIKNGFEIGALSDKLENATMDASENSYPGG